MDSVPSTPAQAQAELISRFQVIEDVQERLAAVVGRARKSAPLREAERTEERRVQGCTSRVWLVPELRDGRCYFRIDADSALVKGLAAFLCEIYQGAEPGDVLEFEPSLLETLHLADHLSPTRRHGLQQVRRVIREFAREAAHPAMA